jgi:hypothetical protein
MYNISIDTVDLSQEKCHFDASSLGGKSQTYHTFTYRSHATSTGKPNIEYSLEIIEFNDD